jgi:peptide/nickel transport system substrate-binding protein
MKTNHFLLFTVILLMISIIACNTSQSPEKQVVSKKNANIVRLQGGDWGYPTPYAHYPRGPGGYKTNLIFDSLLESNEKGLIPWLAKKWETIDNGKHYLFTIRKNVTFHDGTPLTPEDVAFSLEYANQYPQSWSYLYQSIQSVRIQDNRKVLVTVRTPSVPMLLYIGRTRILPKHIWKDITQPQKFTSKSSIIGCGPYRLTDYNKSHGIYRFQAFKNYWGPKPAVQVIEFIPVSQPILAYERGEIDMAVVPPDVLPRFQKDSRNKIVKSPAFWGIRLLFNLKSVPEFQNKALRQAIRYALDLNALVEKTTRGAAIPGSAGILSPDHVLFNPHVKAYEYNVSKAISLLERAGYSYIDKDGTRSDQNGKPLSFQLLCSSGARISRSPISEIRIAEMIKEYLQKAGIHIQVKSADQRSRDAAVKNHQYEMVLLGHGGWGSDPHFLKKRFADDIRQGNSLSECRSFGYHNDRLNAMLNQQAIAFDHQKRKQLIAKIQVLLSEELPEIPLFNTTNYTVFRPSTYDGWCFMYDHHSLSHSKLSFLEKQL